MSGFFGSSEPTRWGGLLKQAISNVETTFDTLLEQQENQSNNASPSSTTTTTTTTAAAANSSTDTNSNGVTNASNGKFLFLFFN